MSIRTSVGTHQPRCAPQQRPATDDRAWTTQSRRVRSER